MERHFRKSLKIYKKRRGLFCEILKSNFSIVIDFKIPEGGMAVWSVFDHTVSLPKLSLEVAKKGLKIADGSFYNNEVFTPDGLRLGFASLNETEIVKSFELLRSVI